MINEENIGKRIKMLRKQKKVSQERMAEELGMYQADISNLERAMGGSGISDIFKLDRIADYFGISLIELLNGFEGAPIILASESKKSEEYEMKHYTLKDAKYGFEGEYFFSEICLEAPDKKKLYVSFSECEDEPRFFQSKESMWELLSTERGDASHEQKLNKACFLSGEDYIDVFQNIESKWVGVCRYLIFIATEDEESVLNLIENTKGKVIENIEIPLPSREPEDIYYVNYADLSVVYRYRLMVEASLKNPSVFSDVENTERLEKVILKKLKEACTSEDAYKVWKKDLVDAKIKDVMEKQKVVVCTYLFAGMGQYDEIMPEEMVESFKCWINQNGSAFFGGVRPANKREIRTYVSQHIADELLGMEPILP